MLPRLRIPDWQPPADGEAGVGGWEVDDTPREGPSPTRPNSSLPSSPSTHRKTKSRAARSYFRTNSLKDAKVLMVSDMHRTESVLDPGLFQYHQHFDSPWQLVGKTHLSEVFRVRHRVTGQVFAVKRSRRRFRSKLQRERCLREIRAVAALPPHPNIVNQYRAWQEGGHFYIQMDFCEGGSLAQRAHQACSQGRCFSDEQLWSTACQAAQGLLFLHSHGVLHLDIKPDNIYLGGVAAAAAAAAGRGSGGPGSSSDSGGGTWRIGDFGLAVARDREGSMDWEEGDGDYVAPELLAAGGEPSPAADIFSLGATLYECATGHKLPRSEGWTEAHVQQLELPHRPPALLRLLRAMLQPNPALRPTAQQVLDAVAQEQPAVAAAAHEVVAAAAQLAALQPAQAAAAALDGSLSGELLQQQQQQHGLNGTPPGPVAGDLPPSPFLQASQRAASAAASAGVQQAQQAQQAAGVSPQHFSFSVPSSRPAAAPPTCGSALTPEQPLRPHNRRSHHHHHSSGGGSGGGGKNSGGPPGSAIKGTPAGRGRLGHGRWAPALSPLISEGALTPGAVAALAGLTPPPAGSRGPCSEGAPTPVLFGNSLCASAAAKPSLTTPLDAWRPAPLQLPVPPHTAVAAPLLAGVSGGSGVGGGSSGRMSLGSVPQHPSSSGTQDSRDGWQLSRRDIVSPDSDLLQGSQSESDYSYSCGTGKTMSELEFADALSPMSMEMGSHLPFAAGHTPSTGGTPENRRHLCQLAAEGDQLEGAVGGTVDDTPSPNSQQGRQAQGQGLERQDSEAVGVPSVPGIAGHLMQMAPSLAWDLHTSPEFLMQLPPGSPDSLSRSSSLDDTSSLPSRGLSVRRFPTLDSWGSQLDGACSSKPPSRIDSLAALAAQRFTNIFASQDQAAPPGTAGEGGACSEGGAGTGASAGSGPSAPTAALGGRGMRKRQHSSRRTLMAALSRDNSIASSIDGMQPVGKSRHIMESGGNSPASEPQQAAAAAALPPRPLLRSGSMLAREALAAGNLAAAKAAAQAADFPGAAGSPSHLYMAQYASYGSHGSGGLLGCGGGGSDSCRDVAAAASRADVAVPPSLTLDACMTCMKLRDTD